MSIRILLLATLLAGSACHQAQAKQEPPARQPEVEVALLEVEGMLNPGCSVLIRKALEGVAGIREVKASFQTKSAEVTFESSKISVQQIQALIKDNVGFDTRLKSVKQRPGAPRAERQRRSEACGCHETPTALAL